MGTPSVRMKRRYLEATKSRPCADCGISFSPECMEFIHARGEKLFTIGSAWRWVPAVKLEAEVEKCDVVCACCFRLRRAKNPPARRGRPPVFLAELEGKISARTEMQRLEDASLNPSRSSA